VSASITVFRTRLPIADAGIATLLAAFLVLEIWVFNAPTDAPVVASIASVAAAGATSGALKATFRVSTSGWAKRGRRHHG
jgi:hypothetical protein